MYDITFFLAYRDCFCLINDLWQLVVGWNELLYLNVHLVENLYRNRFFSHETGLNSNVFFIGVEWKCNYIRSVHTRLVYSVNCTSLDCFAYYIYQQILVKCNFGYCTIFCFFKSYPCLVIGFLLFTVKRQLFFVSFVVHLSIKWIFWIVHLVLTVYR